MLASMAPVPLQTGTLGAVSTGAQAFSVAEGSTKAISKLSLTGQQQNPMKAHCIVVVTQELAKAPGANATQLIGRELRNAVAVTTDAQFITTLIAGLSAATSAGPTAEAVRADIANLLRAITTGQASQLVYHHNAADLQNRGRMLTDQKGVSAFPNLTPQGGSDQRHHGFGFRWRDGWQCDPGRRQRHRGGIRRLGVERISRRHDAA